MEKFKHQQIKADKLSKCKRIRKKKENRFKVSQIGRKNNKKAVRRNNFHTSASLRISDS